MEQHMLTIEFLGQACIALRCHRTGIEIVSDPWFSAPAHLNSWHAFPEWTAEEVEQIRKRIDRATHVYLSHDHADHFDQQFLETLSHKTILVGDFQNERFRKGLRSLSQIHEVRYVCHGETIQLGNSVWAQLFMQQPAFRTDSMLLVRTADGCVLNANDCGLNTATLRHIGRKHQVTIFLFTLNYMANGYPISYLFSGDPNLGSRMQAVRDQTVDMFRLAMQNLNPTLSAAFAGPVTYGDPINEHLNRHPESCNWSAMVAELQREGPVVWPAPFSTIECTEGAVTRSTIFDWERFHAQPHMHSKPLAGVEPFQEQILHAAERFVDRHSDVLRKSSQRVEVPLVLSGVASLDQIESNLPDWSLEIDFDRQRIRPMDKAPLMPPYLQILAPTQILYGLLTLQTNVDDILLSARARFTRDPDTFNPVLHNLLRYGGDELSMQAMINWYVRKAKSTESIAVNVDGEPRRIPKFCPHEGESLESVPITNGHLVCPRHRWKFDLNTGQCVEGDRTVNLYALVEQDG
jgi:UDP-MurNAc hydroxylase